MLSSLTPIHPFFCKVHAHASMRKLISVVTGLLSLCAMAQSSHATVTTITNNVAWVDDSAPAGAILGSDGGDGWTWVSSNPNPVSGTLSSQSSVARGLHQHYFYGATAKVTVGAGDTLVTYVYLDPSNLPREIMVQWSDGSWEHRAYWGANLISYGTDGTASRRYMGALPAAGQWVRLEVPASQVGLEGQRINGMGSSKFDGRVTWDKTGTASTQAVAAAPSAPAAPAAEVVWSDDASPAGAVELTGGDNWNWTTSPAPVSGAKAHQSNLAAGLHEHFFNYAAATITPAAGEALFAYVYIDPANVPTEIMLAWNAARWEHRAYWGANSLNYGTDRTNSRRYMGAMPAAGQWVRLEVPAS